MSIETLKNEIVSKVESPEACFKKVEFSVSKDTMAKEVNDVVKELAQMVVIPGFRKGKAPAKMVRRRFASNVKEEMERRIIGAAFEKIIQDEKLEVVTYKMPGKDTMEKLDFDADFAFSMDFDVAPEFEMPEYKGLKIDVEAAEVNLEDVAKRIAEYKEMYSEYKDIDTSAEKGDMLKVSYSSDFELAEDASASLKRQVQSDDNWVWLDNPETIPGIVEALTGAEKDKEYTFTAEYPADWRDAELAGMKVKYTVKVNNVQRRYPLESDEQLCEKMQLENVDKLNEMIESGLKGQAAMETKNKVREAVYEKLAEQIPAFDLPPSLLASETQKELRNTANSIVKDEAGAEEFKKDIKKHEAEASENAKKKLRRLFILRKVADAEKITVSQGEVDGQIKGMSRYYGYNEKELRSMLEKTGGIEDMQLDILASKATNFLADNAEVNEQAPAKKKTAAKKKADKEDNEEK